MVTVVVVVVVVDGGAVVDVGRITDGGAVVDVDGTVGGGVVVVDVAGAVVTGGGDGRQPAALTATNATAGSRACRSLSRENAAGALDGDGLE